MEKIDSKEEDRKKEEESEENDEESSSEEKKENESNKISKISQIFKDIFLTDQKQQLKINILLI